MFKKWKIQLLILLPIIYLNAQNSKSMLLIKLNGNKAELRQSNGNLVRYIGNNDVLFADINPQQDHILITTKTGKVELRAINNNLVRYIGNGDAQNARFIGNDEIQITTHKGKTEIRKSSNNLLRSF